MCFSLDYRNQHWQVIDGLQRMWTIIRFLSGDCGSFSKIPDVDPAISGRNIRDFLESKSTDQSNLQHSYYQRIQNFTLPITVIRCDHSKSSHMEYLFTIFHRLNTGSVKLNNQEIRNCIYSGTFNNFLHELDRNEAWLKINGRSSPDGDRYRGQELILRFLHS